MLPHEYFESLILIIAQVLLVQLQVRSSDVIIYLSDNTPETSHWQLRDYSYSDEDYVKTNWCLS